MTTIINPGNNEGGNGVGIILTVVVVLVIIFLFFVYGLPALRGGNDGGTNINVPDKINIDVNPTNDGQ